jgi:hypothetical protein
MKQARVQRVGAPATGAALVATVALLAAGCSASASPPVSLPTPTAGDIICYLSLPDSTTSLSDAAASVATRGSSDYRHFRSLSAAARQFGATDAQISAVATSVQGLGLEFAADPTRLFGRVTGTTDQWQAALGTLLSEQAATASSPFTVYSLPHRTPAALQPSGTTLLLPDASVYDPAAAVSSPPAERPPRRALRRRGPLQGLSHGRSTPAPRSPLTARHRCCRRAVSTRRSRSRTPTAWTHRTSQRPKGRSPRRWTAGAAGSRTTSSLPGNASDTPRPTAHDVRHGRA